MIFFSFRLLLKFSITHAEQFDYVRCLIFFFMSLCLGFIELLGKHEFIYFNKFGKFVAIISQIFFLPSCSLLSFGIHLYTYIGFLKLSKVHFYNFTFCFSLSISFWKVSVVMSSSSLILFSFSVRSALNDAQWICNLRRSFYYLIYIST